MAPDLRRSDLYQIRSTLDALDAIVHLVDSHFKANEVFPQPCNLLLDRGNSGDEIGRACIDSIGTFVNSTKVPKNDAFRLFSHRRLPLTAARVKIVETRPSEQTTTSIRQIIWIERLLDAEGAGGRDRQSHRAGATFFRLGSTISVTPFEKRRSKMASGPSESFRAISDE